LDLHWARCLAQQQKYRLTGRQLLSSYCAGQLLLILLFKNHGEVFLWSYSPSIDLPEGRSTTALHPTDRDNAPSFNCIQTATVAARPTCCLEVSRPGPYTDTYSYHSYHGRIAQLLTPVSCASCRKINFTREEVVK
jgi:hypothetical protein